METMPSPAQTVPTLASRIRDAARSLATLPDAPCRCAWMLPCSAGFWER